MHGAQMLPRLTMRWDYCI